MAYKKPLRDFNLDANLIYKSLKMLELTGKIDLVIGFGQSGSERQPERWCTWRATTCCRSWRGKGPGRLCAAALLASAEARYVTGQNIVVDGGITSSTGRM